MRLIVQPYCTASQMIELAREQLEINLSWGKANICAAEEWIGDAEGGEAKSKMCDKKGKEQTAISGISTLR